MYHRPSRKKQLARLISLYTVLTLLVLAIVTFISLFVLGFRFDSDKGHLEQYAFLQFDSSPSGAKVTVDGAEVGLGTPNKTSVPAGKHEVTMSREGYETWSKSVDAKAGVITWLNYTLLVPKILTVEPVATYESVYLTLASPKGRSMLIQRRVDTPTFSLADLSSDKVKSTELTIPASLYSESTTLGVTHTFQIAKWDEGGRYVLIKHTYDAKDEWLVFDTQNVALTKNITQLFNVTISGITFSGTSGNMFYILDSGNIHRLDLSAQTISEPLVSNVTSFGVYESNIITYVGIDATIADKRVVGLYRDGDDKSYVLRTVTGSKDIPLHIITTRYFNEDYVVIAEGKKVDVLGGSYPNTASDDVTSLKIVASFETAQDINEIMFSSPIGQYIFIQSGAYIASYDLEYQTFASSTIEGTGAVPPIKWLDENYVWSDRDGNLTIREFDGSNVHTINSVLVGQDVLLTRNGRYLYSINKVDTGYQLQRVRMILS
ncbi:MAG TPA: PEGA domain-containing protein [Candidatus Angelobacter sp.]|nr:PEGA domain-containing protein [Candidatus Angelobacter sp.]